jgi:hypothetical protein
MRSTKRAKIFSEGGVGGVPSPQTPTPKKNGGFMRLKPGRLCITSQQTDRRNTQSLPLKLFDSFKKTDGGSGKRAAFKNNTITFADDLGPLKVFLASGFIQTLESVLVSISVVNVIRDIRAGFSFDDQFVFHKQQKQVSCFG